MGEGLFILDIDADGSVAAHPRRTELPGLVAPIPEEDKPKKFNTLRPHLIAIGCMGVPNRGFEFDSSFLNPNTEKKFTRFAQLMKALRKQDKLRPKRLPPVSIFGHTDPTGNDDYNKHLSGRRSLAVYGLVTRNTKIWDELFLNTFGGDRWGMRSIRFMLSKITHSDTDEPFFDGEPDGKEPDIDKRTKEAIKAFENDRGVKGGGLGAFPSEKTRKKMYEEYMDILCHDEDGNKFQLDPVEHFIAKKKSPQFRGDVQGCGEFNPIFLLSKAEEDLFASKKEFEEARNELYAKDRRVLIYVFQHDTEIDLTRWPCPPSRTDADKCRIRFWSDAKERLTRGDDQREFKDQQDTMACRFYHGFAHNSQCETGGRLWIIRFRVEGGKKFPVPLRNRRYVLVAGTTDSSAIIRGTLDDKGELRLPVFDDQVKMTLRLDAFGQEFKFPDEDTDVPDEQKTESDAADGFDTDKFEDEDKFLEIELDAGALAAANEDLGAKQRLYNLGFGGKAPEKLTQDEQDRAVRAYRRSRNLSDSTDLESTKKTLETEHELTDVPKPEDDDETVNSSAPAGDKQLT